MVALTPVSIITDIAIGIIGSIYMYRKGESSAACKAFAYKRICIFTAQQLAILLANSAVLVASSFFLPAIFLSTPAYKASIKIADYIAEKMSSAEDRVSSFTGEQETLEEPLQLEDFSAITKKKPTKKAQLLFFLYL